MAADTLMLPQPTEALVTARAAALKHYSPYCFLRDINQQHAFGVDKARGYGAAPFEEVISAGAAEWLFSQLPWDSAYFGTPVYRLFTGLFSEVVSEAEWQASTAQLRTALAARGAFHAFGLVPAEDIKLLQALTGAGWRLIETRLTFYHDAIDSYDGPRAPVRPARPDEAEAIGRIAAEARNPYDRFHADPWYGTTRADAFLARYAAATVTGSYGADVVLVPDEPGLPLDSFIAISDLKADAAILGTALSRVILSAVGPDNRGWHYKLVSEALHRARQLSQRYLLMTTQATNAAVFRTSEKLGFKLGAVSHVLACHLSLPA